MKTIKIDDEAYEILVSLRIDSRDSFSDVVKRHFRRSGSIRASSGAWAETSETEVATLRRETLDSLPGRK
jgi:predicted CopG family antitoxin